MITLAARTLSRAWSLLGLVLRKFLADNGLFLASALAFNLLLYFIPLALLMISLLGYTVLDSERALSEVQSVLKAFLPHSQQALAENLAAVTADRGLLGFAGFALFFVLSTLLFGTVRTVMNRVLRVREERTLVVGMGIDLLMMALSVLLLLLLMGATWFLTIAGALAERYPSWSAYLEPGLVMFGRILGVTFTGLLLFVLYRIAPATMMPLRATILASVTGTVLFQLAKGGFAWYVRVAQGTIELYGALGGVMFLFIWLYYVSVAFIIGAEVGWAYEQQRVARAE